MIRPVRYLDLPALKSLFETAWSEECERRGVDLTGQFARWQQMYPLVRALSLFPNPFQYTMNLMVAEVDDQLAGFVQTSPGNHDQTRWHIDYLAVAPSHRLAGVAEALLDDVFERYGERATSFTMEVDTRNVRDLGTCASKGFRKYAVMSYYQLPPERHLAFPPIAAPGGLRPYRPRDAAQLLELYNACTPASVRLVDSRSVEDFELGLIEHTLSRWRRKLGLFDDLRYVVEHDRQILAHLRILAHDRPVPHSIRLTVHPGYEDLYEPLMAYALGKLRGYPEHLIVTWAADFQHGRRAAVEGAGFALLTADDLLVRDGLKTIRMPAQGLQKLDEATLKPAFYG